MAEHVRIGAPFYAAVRELPAIGVSAVPWYVWSAALAVTSTTVGLYWDISWHIGIGRDTFWTPAHLAIQFGAVLTGLSCAYLILHTTFAGDEVAKENAVRIWGLRGPLGAFIAAWGGFCMLTSAPFDNWWHDSYGLDVTILSPPHVVLLLGIFVMGVGGLILTTARMNLASGQSRSKFNQILLCSGALLLCLLLMLGFEYVGDQTLMHSAIYYRVLGMIAPVVLVGIGSNFGRSLGCDDCGHDLHRLVGSRAIGSFPCSPHKQNLDPCSRRSLTWCRSDFPCCCCPVRSRWICSQPVLRSRRHLESSGRWHRLHGR